MLKVVLKLDSLLRRFYQNPSFASMTVNFFACVSLVTSPLQLSFGNVHNGQLCLSHGVQAYVQLFWRYPNQHTGHPFCRLTDWCNIMSLATISSSLFLICCCRATGTHRGKCTTGGTVSSVTMWYSPGRFPKPSKHLLSCPEDQYK